MMKDKTVFITGATGDFGKAFAHKFASEGARLVLHGRDEEKLRALCEALEVETYPILFDLRDRVQTMTALENIPADFQEVDVLVNNAGGALGQDKAQDSHIEDWEFMVEANVTSLLRVTDFVLKKMIARQSGHIINISSIAGNYPYPGGHVYCGVKAFVRQFSMAMRADLGGTNVRVSSIEPGMAETTFSLKRFKGDKEKADAVYVGAQALQAKDIAEAVFWAATQPPHVNINRMEIMPTRQSPGALQVFRD